ncbi:S8 family serine peptidase [Natrinema marinum]|uniref:S8 family serine peptidase n=1 Tax=Natrinema marinum TaxID=2961598 RepID=UPI0020C8416A|nr:S8 family serine peptidase [Natrinema marinum]
MFPRSPETGRVRSVSVLGVLFLVVCSLVAAPLSSAAAAATVAESGGSVDGLATAGTDADGGTARSDGGSDITIDSALEADADGETVDVIVRLSEANVSPREPPEQAATRLQRHAERTQGEIVSYARSTDGVAIENRFWLTNAVLLEVDTSRVDLESFGRFEEVSTLHANFEVELDGAAATSASTGAATAGTDSTASTAGVSATYGLEQINATDVWDEYGVNGSGATVAVLDTGVDASHPDIDLYTNNSSDPTYPGGWAEFDQYGRRVSGSTPQDFGDHGTHVSATVAGGNASGTHIGVAPGVDLLHGAVLTDCETGCSGTYSQIIEGMQWAIDRDADVVSMSLGAQTYAEQFIDPVRNAQSSGTIVVSSSGNGGNGTSGSPGNVYDTFAIGAATETGDIATFSSGETIVTDDAWSSPPADWPDSYTVPNVAAPGSWVESAVPGGGYQSKSGTSMAAPHVTGSIALLLSANENLQPDEVTAALEETAWKPDGEPAGQDTRYGHGIIDVKAAVDATSLVTLSGTVTDRAGEPVANATVSVDGGRWNATTNATGAYELQVIPGDRTVTVDATGHHPDTETLSLSSGTAVTHDVTLDFVTVVDGGLPEPLESNSSVTTTFNVTGLENLTITRTENATLAAGELEFEAGGQRFGANETVSFDPAVTNGTFDVTTYLADDVNGTLELDHEFVRSNETQTMRTGSLRVVPEIYAVGVVAQSGDDAAERLRTNLTARLPIAYRTSHVNTSDAVSAAESGSYDVFVALELPATDDTLSNPTATFVNATTANDTGVLYLGDGVGDDALVRLARNTSEVGGLETPSSNGTVEVVLDRNHPIFAGVGGERDAVTLLENATNRTWFDAPGARTLASATDDGVLADGEVLSFDRPDEQILLGVTPQAGRLTDDGRTVLSNAVAYLGAGRFHVSDDFDAYGVSNASAETATFAVPETGNVTIALAGATTADPANLTITVNGTEIAPGDEIAVDRDAVEHGLAVDVTAADGVDGEDVTLAATFENETVTTSSVRFERDPPARYAGTVAVNGEPARDGLAVRVTHNGTVLANTTTADGRFGVPTAAGGTGVLEVNASTVPDGATLNVSLENATTNASLTPTAGEQVRTDLAVAYDDPFSSATVSAPWWAATGDEINVSIAFDDGADQYITERTWLESYDAVSGERWNATHTFAPGDEGLARIGATLTDLAGETRTVSSGVLVIDGGVARVNGTISRPAAGPKTLAATAESGVNGSVFVTPAHGNWTDERPVENGEFEAATEENVSTHGVFLEDAGTYPTYQTVLNREVSDNETVAVELDLGHELAIEVTNESGGGVANASVAVTPIDTSATEHAVVTRTTATNESGRWLGPNGDGLGASVNGTVTITVTPPENAEFADETCVRTIAVDGATTASFELAARSGGGGGGGGGGIGGGGGFGSGSATKVIQLTSTTTADGDALLEVTGSREGLPAETMLTGVGADGVSFERVRIVPATSRTNYEFTIRPGTRTAASHRDGAVSYASFDHDGIADTIGWLTLEFAVDDEALPAGTTPDDVVLSAYRDGEWQPVRTRYDAETETYTATLTGLPSVAIGVEGATPAFEVIDASLEPSEVRSGDPVRIEATVENVGDVAGTREFTIAADGDPIATERVGLAAGERATISLEATLESSATVTIDGSTVGDVTVTDEAEATQSAASPSGPLSETVPGFGGLASVAAIAAVLLGRGSFGLYRRSDR